MNTLKRTLITFAAFIINYYLVIKVHQDVQGINSLQHGIVWLVFLMMTAVSISQWDLSWLFGSYVYVYAIMILAKTPLSVESAIATGIVAVMTVSLFELPSARWLKTLFADGLGKGIREALASVSDRWTNWFVLRRMRRLAGVKGAAVVGEAPLIEEFLQMERDVLRVRGFFDGSDPALERAMLDTMPQVEGLQKDHARLVLRSSHLQGLIAGEPREPLEKEMTRLSEEAARLSDPVVKAQLVAAVEMKRRRLAEVDKFEVCLKRVQGQRLQLVETVQGTHNQLNSLKYSDIQTLKASRDAISESIRQVRGRLDFMQEGMLETHDMMNP